MTTPAPNKRPANGESPTWGGTTFAALTILLELKEGENLSSALVNTFDDKERHRALRERIAARSDYQAAKHPNPNFLNGFSCPCRSVLEGRPCGAGREIKGQLHGIMGGSAKVWNTGGFCDGCHKRDSKPTEEIKKQRTEKASVAPSPAPPPPHFGTPGGPLEADAAPPPAPAPPDGPSPAAASEAGPSSAPLMGSHSGPEDPAAKLEAAMRMLLLEQSARQAAEGAQQAAEAAAATARSVADAARAAEAQAKSEAEEAKATAKTLRADLAAAEDWGQAAVEAAGKMTEVLVLMQALRAQVGPEEAAKTLTDVKKSQRAPK